jgi:hypothetical protein
MFASLNSNGFEHIFQKIRVFRRESIEPSYATPVGLEPNAIDGMNKLKSSSLFWVKSQQTKICGLDICLQLQHSLRTSIIPKMPALFMKGSIILGN